MAHCRSGGTGRRARLRGVWGNPWGFESPLRHHADRKPATAAFAGFLSYCFAFPLSVVGFDLSAVGSNFVALRRSASAASPTP
jgi:hypothetical protein